MDGTSVQGPDVSVDSCGCSASPRRICDACRTAKYVFMACSLACLRRHQADSHGDRLPTDAGKRARDYQRVMNRHAPGVRDRYAEHRRQLMHFVPTPTVAGGGDVCVFGAGNCADVDLEQLSRTFSQIHLVDIDGEAIERGRDSLPTNLKARVVLHPNVDLSGLLDRIDEWGDTFPPDEVLGRTAVAAAHAIVAGIGRNFEVTVSSCVLSQLGKPFQDTWVTSETTWGNLDAAITAVHLATLAGATRPGGQGFIAFDVLSSDHAPGLADKRGQAAAALEAFVASQTEAGEVVLQPDPQNLLLQLQSPGLGAMFASPRLTPPWLWDIGDGLQLVYGIIFQRR